MTPILHCDWLPEWALPAVSMKKMMLLMPYKKSFIHQVCSNQDGCLFLFYVFMDLESVSVHKQVKKTLANIQPS